jgi:hypothetical protein
VTSEKNAEPKSTNDRPERLTRAERLRRVDEALARQLEARKRFFEALERLDRLARR